MNWTKYKTPSDLPWDLQEEWGERAAIREYDGGQSREEAETQAFIEILARIKEKQDADSVVH